MQSPYEPVKQSMYLLGNNTFNWMNLKLNPNKSASASIEKIEAAFKKNIPSAPFDYKFADDEYDKKFAAEERVGKLAAFFAILAVLISCLGLFGLSSFVAEQRTKEIGVRKVLGASVANIVYLLSTKFTKLVIVAIIIAVPLAWFAINSWLKGFAYHIDVSWGIFGAASLLVLLIAWFTVSYESIKAAIANPVKSLRTE